MELDLQFIPPGDDIYTQDGERIGQVKQIHNGYLRVDATAQPDYWLPAGLVSSFSDGRIVVAFDKDRLSEYKADRPGSEEA